MQQQNLPGDRNAQPKSNRRLRVCLLLLPPLLRRALQSETGTPWRAPERLGTSAASCLTPFPSRTLAKPAAGGSPSPLLHELTGSRGAAAAAAVVVERVPLPLLSRSSTTPSRPLSSSAGASAQPAKPARGGSAASGGRLAQQQERGGRGPRGGWGESLPAAEWILDFLLCRDIFSALSRPPAFGMLRSPGRGGGGQHSP